MAIDIQEDDILWRFYCKKFVLKGEEIQKPGNLCFYVRTAMKGFFFWLSIEAKLSVILITVLATFEMLVFTIGSLYVIPVNAFTAILVIALVVLLLLLLATITVAVFDRIYCLIEKQAVWIMLLVVFLFFGYNIVQNVSQGIFLLKLFDAIREIGLFMLMVAGTGVVIFVSILISWLVPYGKAYHHFQQLSRFLHTVIVYAKTIKRPFCPLVNPPEGFKTKE